jgi:3-phenylpropionate/cinnamic acid dioxygenase small subunit
VPSTEWEHKLAIREVLERYMRYNDDGALDRLVSLFEENAIYQVTGHVNRGHSEIRSFLQRSGAFVDGRPLWTDDGALYNQPRSVHVCSNPLIDVDGNEATCESDFVVISRREDGHAFIQLVGRYRDQLHRGNDNQWRFTKRTGVSVARPGGAARDTEWQRALASMDDGERAKLN